MEAAIAGIVFFYIAIMAFYIVVQWKIYEKAGKPGWAAIIPIYNFIVLLEITGKPTWWIFLFFIPGVNIVFAIIMLNQLSLSFGKDSGFTLGLVFLWFIFFPILAFGDAKYLGPGGRKAPAEETF